jgi:hypothetical protein
VAREAEEIGLVDVGRRLREAAKSMEEASALLEAAMKEFSYAKTTEKLL